MFILDTNVLSAEDLAGRVLPFDTNATAIYAELYPARRRVGRPVATANLIIASVARAQGAASSHATSAVLKNAVSPSSIRGRCRDARARNRDHLPMSEQLRTALH
jgi:hypothetical protein